MRSCFSVVVAAFPLTTFSQPSNSVETADIDNFWNAYDRLNMALTTEDSIQIIQEGCFTMITQWGKVIKAASGFRLSHWF